MTQFQPSIPLSGQLPSINRYALIQIGPSSFSVCRPWGGLGFHEHSGFSNGIEEDVWTLWNRVAATGEKVAEIVDRSILGRKCS